MTPFLLALALRQSTVSGLLFQTFPKDRLLAARVPRSSTGRETFANEAALLSNFGLVGRFEADRVAGFAWDSSGLLPSLYVSEGDRMQSAAAQGLGLLGSLLSNGTDGLVPPVGQHGPGADDGIEIGSLPARAADYVKLVAPDASKLLHFGTSKLTVSFDSYVTFTSADGRTESFVLKPSREGGNLPSVTRAIRRGNEGRLPRELRNILATVRYAPAVPVFPVPIRDLASTLSRVSGVHLGRVHTI